MRLHNIRPLIVPITEFIDISVVAEISDLPAGCNAKLTVTATFQPLFTLHKWGPPDHSNCFSLGHSNFYQNPDKNINFIMLPKKSNTKSLKDF